MAKDDERRLTPKLRFPEFRRARAWAQKQAGELFTNRLEHGDDGLPIYSVTIDDGMVKRSSLDRKVDDIAESEGNKRVHKNDIAYNMMRMWQGAFGVAVEDCMVSPAYVVLTPQEGVSSEFFGRLLKTPCLLRSLTSHSHGLTKDRLRLYYKDFAQIALPLPSLAEQQKIADCLTSLDELIAAQGRKVEAMRAHKKGLMQQLFPREGETRPSLRFPEFRNAPEWEETKLDDLAKRRTGHTPSKANPSYYNGGIKWVSLADSKRLDNGLISQTEIEISQEGIDNSSAVLHPAGSVILSRDAGVGKSAVTAFPMAVSQHFIVWICQSRILSNWFLYFVLQKLKPMFEQIATGSTIKTIGMPFFNAMRINVPTFAEQQQIADCLCSLDARITGESNKLAALKAHKQGLMQQLFPSPEGTAM